MLKALEESNAMLKRTGDAFVSFQYQGDARAVIRKFRPSFLKKLQR